MISVAQKWAIMGTAVNTPVILQVLTSKRKKKTAKTSDSMEIAQKEQGATLAIAIWGLTDISRATLLCPTLTCRCVCMCFPRIIKEQLVACGAPVECMCVCLPVEAV